MQIVETGDEPSEIDPRLADDRVRLALGCVCDKAHDTTARWQQLARSGWKRAIWVGADKRAATVLCIGCGLGQPRVAEALRLCQT